MVSQPTASGQWVGAPVRRIEDRYLLAGAGRFVDDIAVPGVLHAAFVRSPHASARIVGIDAVEARVMPGVEFVFAAGDLGLPGLTSRLDRPEFAPTEMPVLAHDRVRYAGEPVAVVLATSRAAAEDAAESVAVDYEPLELVAGVAGALAPDAPSVHEEAPGNVLVDVSPFDAPDLEEALARAAVVVEGVFTSGRLSAMPLEPRGCLAEWDAREGRLVVHTSTQVPHVVRLTLSQVLGLAENRIRVISPDVGGGFGQKCVAAREELALAAIARDTGRAVRWTEDRQENLAADYQGHEQEHRVRAGFDGEGRLVALDADILCDTGAYSCFPFTCAVEPLMASGEYPGVYKVPRYRARARAVATNKPPMAPYRGVSRPQIVLAMERLMKKAASALGLSEIEVRRRNLVQPDEFPYRGVTGIVYDAGSYAESLETCAEAAGFRAWPDRQAAYRAEGRLVGLGFACFSERSAYGTEAFAQRRMAVTPGFENALVRMDGSGGVLVTVSSHSHGQGHATSFAQIAADRLGVHPGQVLVRYGDTDEAPPGWGTFASRSLGIAGSAVGVAAGRVADRLQEIAGHLLEAAAHEIELRDGQARIVGSEGPGMPIAELARIAHQQSHRLPAGDRLLEAAATFDPPGTFSNATHAALVEVDPGTGAVRVLRYLVVEDCGVMVNPLIVEGQVRGGVAQGIGAALLERLVYDIDGQPLASSLADYLPPTAAEVPDIEIHHLVTPSAFTETGAKGMGEGGLIGAPAAIANAVTDALAHLRLEFDSIPILPDQVAAAIAGAGSPGMPR